MDSAEVTHQTCDQWIILQYRNQWRYVLDQETEMWNETKLGSSLIWNTFECTGLEIEKKSSRLLATGNLVANSPFQSPNYVWPKVWVTKLEFFIALVTVSVAISSPDVQYKEWLTTWVTKVQKRECFVHSQESKIKICPYDALSNNCSLILITDVIYTDNVKTSHQLDLNYLLHPIATQQVRWPKQQLVFLTQD